jgi:hypothetical protein
VEKEITADSHVMGEFVSDWLHPRLLGQWFFRSFAVTVPSRSYDLRVYDVSQLPQYIIFLQYIIGVQSTGSPKIRDCDYLVLDPGSQQNRGDIL